MNIVLSVLAFVLWYGNLPTSLPILYPIPLNNHHRAEQQQESSLEKCQRRRGRGALWYDGIQYYLRAAYYSGQWDLSAGCKFQRIMSQFI